MAMTDPNNSVSTLIKRSLCGLALLAALAAWSAPAQADVEHAYDLFRAEDWSGARLAALPAAAAGDARAMLLLGILAERGLGAAANAASARDWYRRALDVDPSLGAAALQLGFLTERGEGGGSDRAAALRLYLQAAATGLAEAQYNAGRLLLDPEAGTVDALGAFVQLAAAARQGVAPATAAVATLSREVGRDPPVAGRWQIVDVTAAADDPFWAAAPDDALFGGRVDLARGTMRIGATECARANYLPEPADPSFGLAFAGATSPIGLDRLFRSADLAVVGTLCDGAPGPTLLFDATGALRALLLGRIVYVTEPRPSPLVAAVQQALADRGAEVGSPDGVIGPRSRDAIAALRAAAGFSAVPAINRRTLDLLAIPER
jgi:TPR repeat protein